MAEATIYKGKTVITASEAENGFSLLDTSDNFAFVLTANPDYTHVVPVTKTLKIKSFRFDALDFLKFRQGVKDVGEPWKYIMVLNGIFSINVTPGTKDIAFYKMPEFTWMQILPALKETLEFNRHQLLFVFGRFEVTCPHCSKTVNFEHKEQNWTRDAATEFLYCSANCPECGNSIELINEDKTDLYYASEVTTR